MRQIVTLVALLILSPLALAQKPPAGKVSAPSDSGGGGSHGISGPLYLDIAIHVTSSSASVQGQSQTLALNQQGISLTLAPMWESFFLGVGTDYRIVNNSKAPDAQVGSLKGSRWAELVLTAGYLGESFLLKVEYQPHGDFHLAQPTYQGASVTYSGGGGLRLGVLYSLYSGLMVGPCYESLQFSNRFDSVNGQVANESLKMTQIGLTGAYVF